VLCGQADSILIDEARTPLIISKQIAAPQPKYGAAKKLVEFLKKGVHYEVDEKAQSVLLTDQGIKDCERVLGKGLFDVTDPWMSFVTNGVKAKELLQRDKDYIVRGECPSSIHMHMHACLYACSHACMCCRYVRMHVQSYVCVYCVYVCDSRFVVMCLCASVCGVRR
jgi:hypothetical protein